MELQDHAVTQEVFSLLECNACRLRLTQDAPSSQAIAPYYDFEDYISHTNTRKGGIHQLYQWVRRFTLRQKRRMVESRIGRSSGHLLDLGSGTGAFAAVMQKSGWQVTAIEPDEGARKVALEQFGVSALEATALYQLPHHHFDVITLWHVLEHMHDLQQVISQLRQLLKPDGQLFIAVPNYTSYDAHAYGEHWAAYDVPRHLYHFSPGAMRSLLTAQQLMITDTLPMWFDSVYVALLSTKYKFGRANYLHALWTGLLSNFKTLADKERCSSLIYCCRQWPH